MPIFIVCLARPTLRERRPDWEHTLPRHTLLELSHLSTDLARDLSSELLRLLDPQPEPLLDLIATRSAGNPFYAEELVKMLIGADSK